MFRLEHGPCSEPKFASDRVVILCNNLGLLHDIPRQYAVMTTDFMPPECKNVVTSGLTGVPYFDILVVVGVECMDSFLVKYAKTAIFVLPPQIQFNSTSNQVRVNTIQEAMTWVEEKSQSV